MSSEELRDAAGFSAEEIELLAYLLDEEGVAAAPRQTIPARRQHDDPPLSYAQGRLWFLDQWQPNDSSYNIPVALTLRGWLDCAALRCSLAALIQRHESLRTTFAAVAGRPIQVIAPRADAPLTLLDLAALPDVV